MTLCLSVRQFYMSIAAVFSLHKSMKKEPGMIGIRTAALGQHQILTLPGGARGNHIPWTSWRDIKELSKEHLSLCFLDRIQREGIAHFHLTKMVQSGSVFL